MSSSASGGRYILRYQDTRGLDDSNSVFTDVVIKGIASGGGLYVPASLPALSVDEVLSFHSLPYHGQAAHLFEVFGVDVDSERTSELMVAAYGRSFDTPAVAPVVEAAPGRYILELWHGPTSAFKDMALQCMPLFFSEAVGMKQAEGDLQDDYLILVATSGDTGKAALEGFAGRDHVRIVVFYPAEGVSDIQRRQMVTQAGANVAVFGVEGDFDDCQDAVKAVFSDEAFNRELHGRHGLRLSSANSINWGRLLPQIVYYVSAYADMAASGAVSPGRPIDVCVPTGNFGNILAAYYAKHAGVPIERLLCASNENRILTDFLTSGVYDLTRRKIVKTPSPSMDILISSNLERLLFEVSRNQEKVHRWASELAVKRRFQIDSETLSTIGVDFTGDSVTNDACLATIKRVWDKHGYLLDPHTAVAWAVAERGQEDRPVLVVATAHWAKFGRDVYKALTGVPFAEPLPPADAALSGIQLSTKVREMTPGQQIPGGLAALDNLEQRFQEVIEESAKGVRLAILNWLDSPSGNS